MATTSYNETFLKLFNNNITKAHWLDHIIEDTIPLDGSRAIDYLQFNLAGTATSFEGIVSWNPNDWTLNIDSGQGPILQTGQEMWTIVYNGTGSELANGIVVSPVGQVGGRPSVAPAIADTHETIHRPIYVTTMAIPNGTYGIATRDGYVRDIDTSGYVLGQEIYISTTVAGEMQSAKPIFPHYPVRVGGVTTLSSGPGELDGEIFIAIGGSIHETTQNFWNGVFRESFDLTVSSNGTIVTASLEPQNGHPDMTMIFSDGFTMLDTDPAATIILTSGTSTIPQQNFIYIPQSTKVLTVSTSDWPTTEHIKVACICLLDATTTQTDGALRNQNWNDHIQDTNNNQGHLSHITERVRQMPAAWQSGTECTVTIDSIPDPDSVTLATTAGVIYQLHKQIWNAQDMDTGDNIHVFNDSVAPYKIITDINEVTLDSTGSSLSNRHFSIVLWGIMNKSGEPSHMMINLPSGSYLSASNAIEDASNYSDYTIPKPMQGVAFLIARLTFHLSSSASGTWVLSDNQDLRGTIPSAAGGGGAGGTGVSSWTALIDTPSSFTGQGLKISQVNSAETALEFIDNTIAAHSDTTATGTELETLTDGSNADVLHAHVSPSHIVASHSDTTATGAELETLTDDSLADALHRHGKLYTQDGVALGAAIDASLNFMIYADIKANSTSVDIGDATTAFGNIYGTNIYSGGNVVLTTADEGAGNGLDADTVDSLEASQFLRSDAVDSSSENITINGLEVGGWFSSSIYKGLFHPDHINEEYIIMNKDDNTLISASTDSNVIIRGGNNVSTYEIKVYPNQAATMAGNRILTVADEGTGNGLDADTVDTYEASALLDRTNHTGIQTASTISDFDTEVGNHTDVIANTSARHNESHTVASHSDTTATGAELETLTDNSVADSLHRHSALYTPNGIARGCEINASLQFMIYADMTAYSTNVDVGTSTNPFGKIYANEYHNGSIQWLQGSGSPEGVKTAAVGSLYSRSDGGTGTTLYVKESGTGNTGWVAK